MPKILFIAAHRQDRSPSQRFRFEQYFGFLRVNDFQCELSYIIDEDSDKIFYSPGNFHRKLWITFKSALKRLKDVKRADQYDIIVVQREAFMTGSSYFEKQFACSNAKLVFDFDDSIWLLDTSNANKKWEWLKDSEKTSRIIAMSDMIFAGNQYLADYAGRFNKNVRIVPTTIDTNEYKRESPVGSKEVICIGWSGSITTIKHFEYAIPFLLKIKQKYGDRVSIKVIGDSSYVHNDLEIQGITWTKKDEIKELSGIDIGIMPLPTDEWSEGKCGLKGLQYMALEVVTIMSPVGVNTEIIKDNLNGFLAGNEEEWVDKISQLIESFELRQKIGKEGRKTVVDHYSVESQKNIYLENFKELLKK